MNTDIFLITSVINTGNAPWSYSNLRSVYSPEQRFQQTIKTIESIRSVQSENQIKICLCEGSEISAEMKETLLSIVDYYIEPTDEHIRSVCLNSYIKGYGELLKIKYVVNYFMNNNITFQRLFKISGRYYLNENFKLENYSLDKFTFKLPVNIVTYSTVIFSVPYSLLEIFINAINETEKVYRTGKVFQYEDLLPSFMNPKHTIELTGFNGSCAVDGIPFSG